MRRLAPLLLLSALSAFAGCRRERAPTAAAFARGLDDYLRVRGDLCLGLAQDQWPIDVWPGSPAAHDRNALQMPVLEKLGLVSSAPAVAETTSDAGARRVAVRRYRLTDAGRAATRRRPGLAGAPGVTDLCVARLTRDRVTGWQLTGGPAGRQGALVHYTYRVDAVPWVSDPDARRVFPMVDRVVRGAGTAELEEAFTLTAGGWVANELVPPSAPAVARGP
ncbi:MAG TPA: hypothetical protein VHO06_04080 [Polyangia bacterium]|nr:hypothetical protein [Polyangia bacterium]